MTVQLLLLVKLHVQRLAVRLSSANQSVWTHNKHHRKQKFYVNSASHNHHICDHTLLLMGPNSIRWTPSVTLVAICLQMAVLIRRLHAGYHYTHLYPHMCPTHICNRLVYFTASLISMTYQIHMFKYL